MHIVDWLESVKEYRAAKWFFKTWTGEHGNSTNASGHRPDTSVWQMPTGHAGDI
jgi:hypothetical protein